MTKKIAIVDMGTNTFHLLIAEANGKGSYSITHRDRLVVKIGQGGINQGYITEEGINRALRAMHNFKDTISQQDVQKTYAFGTSALRNASNKDEIVSRIKSATGIVPSIISGDVEAEYIYLGVRYGLDLDNKKSLIVDIGGGSVECILCDNGQIFWKESFEIGAQRLLEKFQKSDPITKDEITKLNHYFETSLVSLFEILREYNPTTLIGASGSFDTLSDIFCFQNDIQKNSAEIESPLSMVGFYEIYQDLISKNREQRMQIPGMIEMRVDMIVVASCLIHYILSRHMFNRIRVSPYSLQEGVLASLIQTTKSTESAIT